VERRRTGDSGLRLSAGPAGSVAWWAKLLFIVALLAGFAGPLAGLAGMPALPGLEHPTVQVSGVLLAVAAVVATVGAQLDMGRSWRIGLDPAEETQLVICGAFAHVRNPVFTAMVAAMAGLALTVPNTLAVLAVLLLVAAVQLQVRVIEEPYLIRVHAESYLSYATRVGRFVPGVGRLRRPAPARVRPVRHG
jgi:protein-S-isoprenylcysteine O-methyltransferase Ste14